MRRRRAWCLPRLQRSASPRSTGRKPIGCCVAAAARRTRGTAGSCARIAACSRCSSAPEPSPRTPGRCLKLLLHRVDPQCLPATAPPPSPTAPAPPAPSTPADTAAATDALLRPRLPLPPSKRRSLHQTPADRSTRSRRPRPRPAPGPTAPTPATAARPPPRAPPRNDRQPTPVEPLAGQISPTYRSMKACLERSSGSNEECGARGGHPPRAAPHGSQTASVARRLRHVLGIPVERHVSAFTRAGRRARPTLGRCDDRQTRVTCNTGGRGASPAERTCEPFRAARDADHLGRASRSGW
jgi:hypothetical protein